LKSVSDSQLPNYKFTQLPNEPGACRKETAEKSRDKESGKHEGSGIGKKDLRQVQDRAPQGRSARDLRKLETQAETGLSKIGNCQNRVIG
jgi:hypothetical protein